MSKRVAVLAVQGAFIEHENKLKQLGADCFELRQKKDLESDFDAIILPGGESTVMGKLIRELDMYDIIKEKILSGMPVFGTCAGLLMLASKISNDDRCHLGTMNISAKRNAYGRQLGSFNSKCGFKGIGEIPLTFIRAPYIESAGDNVDILCRTDGKAVAARQDNQLVTAFHPELTEDLSVHKYFLDMIK